MKDLLQRRIVRFGLVGGVGFVVDGGLLTVLSQVYGVEIHLARLCSFLAATLVTWLLNRWLVFRMGRLEGPRGWEEYGRYLLVQVAGALVNLGVFSLVVQALPALQRVPVIPLAVGAVFGMALNYTGARYWVYRKLS